MADVANPVAKIDGSVEKKEKPVKPDEATYKEDVKKAEKAHADAQEKFKAMKAKLDGADQSKNKDTPQAKRRAELLAELKEIRDKQAGGKDGRSKVFDEIKREDEKLKKLIADQKEERSKNPYKSVDDLEREISRLDKQVESGTMKIVDEKKALAEMSTLRKKRSAFDKLDKSQKDIEETKKKLASLRSTLDNPESKALSEKYNTLQGELDAIKSEQDDVYKNFKSLRDEKDRLNKVAQEKWTALRKIKDDYHNALRAANQWDFQARQILREKRKTEQEAYEKEKKKERAQKMLAEASDKAYLDEIRRAESLIYFLDPSYKKENAPLQAPSGLQAQAQRTIDDSGLKGFKVVKKDDEEDYFKGTGGKKGKKGRKGAAGETATPPASGKYKCPPSVMEDCASMGIDPPMSAAEIPAVLEKVKAKLAHWKEDQEAQTQKNIEKAQKEVERLEAEETSSNGTSAPVNGHGDGETKATATPAEGGSAKNELELEKAAEEDVSADLKAASLEDAKTAE